jgi:hypothetical protein
MVAFQMTLLGEERCNSFPGRSCEVERHPISAKCIVAIGAIIKLELDVADALVAFHMLPKSPARIRIYKATG